MGWFMVGFVLMQIDWYVAFDLREQQTIENDNNFLFSEIIDQHLLVDSCGKFGLNPLFYRIESNRIRVVHISN